MPNALETVLLGLLLAPLMVFIVGSVVEIIGYAIDRAYKWIRGHFDG